MANQSKYSFSEVEKKLDIIKDNQGSNKVLLGDGTYGEKPKDGIDGDDGVGIGNIQKTNTVGLVDTYTITFTDGNSTTFTVSNGKDGEDGTDGVGIASVQKTGTNGLVDTYTITFTDGNTTTFEITNGADGTGSGTVSDEDIAQAVEEYLTANPPSGVSQSDIETAVNDYMTENADNVKGEDGVGILKIEKTSTVDLVDTYTITYTNNTTSTYTVTNGKDGESGGTVSDEQIATAVETYLTENPVDGLTDEEKELLGKIVTDGDGTKFLADDGEYKNVEATVYYYEPLVIETSSGIYRKADGTIGDNTIETDENVKRVTATNADQYVSVVAGEVYRMTVSSVVLLGSFNATQCVFLDDDDNFVATAFDTLNYKEDVLVTVPEGATRMHFTLWSNGSFSLERQTTKPYGVVNKVELENELYRNQLEQANFSRKTFAPFDKGYISFVCDDTRNSVSEIVNVFVNKGVPLCIAAIHSAFNNLANGGGTVLDAVKKAVENGGEVLAHNGTPITEAEINDFDSMYEVFAKNKEMLEKYGFYPHGIILAGGTGQIVGDMRTDKWVRKYYLYSDLYGETSLGYPYYHYRTALSNLTLDKAKAKVDDAIANKEWTIFYLHEWMEFSQSDMEALLDYINAKDERELGIKTYGEIYGGFVTLYPKTVATIIANKVTSIYETGATINTDDIEVTVYYRDGSSEVITSGITVDLTDIDVDTEGIYFMSVTYGKKTVYLPITIYTAGTRTVLYSGKDGSYITWELYNDGVMEMTNTATWKQDITTYTADGGQPWAEHMSLIKKVKFNAGSSYIGKIGDYAFYGATNLTELDLSENTGGVTIAQYALGNCGFTTPTFENVYKIDTHAFNGSSMTEITLGAGVLSYNTFAGCDSLTTVRFTNDTMTIDGNTFYGVRGIVTDIYVPWAEGTVDLAPWGATSATVHYNTTT